MLKRYRSSAIHVIGHAKENSSADIFRRVEIMIEARHAI